MTEKNQEIKVVARHRGTNELTASASFEKLYEEIKATFPVDKVYFLVPVESGFILKEAGYFVPQFVPVGEAEQPVAEPVIISKTEPTKEARSIPTPQPVKKKPGPLKKVKDSKPKQVAKRGTLETNGLVVKPAGDTEEYNMFGRIDTR